MAITVRTPRSNVVIRTLEAIAEFKVLTSNYGAQYGRNGSGTVEVETKSGTSSFHGSAFYYGRNEVFNARSWEEGADPSAKKAPYRKQDWGYTFGGPVYIPNHYNSDKKKTFFFWSRNGAANRTRRRSTRKYRRRRNEGETSAISARRTRQRFRWMQQIIRTARRSTAQEASRFPAIRFQRG